VVRLLAHLARHRARVLWGLVAVGAILRLALVASCPTAFGYVFDYYHEAIQIAYDAGRLPIAADCWQCYHPPVFYLLGKACYAAGLWLARASDDPAETGLRMLSLLSLTASTIAAVFGYRVVRFVVRDRALSLVGAALILAFPCLFVGADSPEADIVVTAIMSVFLDRLVRFAAAPSRQRWREATIIGILSGLAAATKYSGLIALGTAGVTVAILLVTGGGMRGLRRGWRPRVQIAALGLLVLAATIAVGGWKYVDNERRYGRPLFANGSAGDAFSEEHEYFWDQYDFTSFDLRGAVAAGGPHPPAGELTHLAIYRSVWTTLYAMGWSDLSFFSVAGRIGDPTAPYPDKHIPPWLVGSVLYLALVPTLLAGIGLIVTASRRSHWPLLAMFVLTLASYLLWVLAQDEWALKTKYILFLLPIYVVWTVEGLRWVRRRAPAWTTDAVVALLVLLIVVAYAWQAVFALA